MVIFFVICKIKIRFKKQSWKDTWRKCRVRKKNWIAFLPLGIINIRIEAFMSHPVPFSGTIEVHRRMWYLIGSRRSNSRVYLSRFRHCISGLKIEFQVEVHHLGSAMAYPSLKSRGPVFSSWCQVLIAYGR